MGARVKEVREGGAAAGKVKPGELLLTINGEDCLNKPFTEVRASLIIFPLQWFSASLYCSRHPTCTYLSLAMKGSKKVR